ncbi:DUF3995 domain-containing protein [Muriicola sp. Z0-33]|uniref:DUF3995 domain-containing protein n=1 Tax=Muriicola sp. Z0-33 TaxID=2816957 RepID=UPI00223888F8|nr:DUF3995 domain-containing protein [Muriicola sp. Z0-33]MCW5516938.1 DUF3995 domain-containing protein [Muriicola sp. Z0-33]
MILPILLSLILLGLGIIHFYWAIGGKIAFSNSLPTKENGKKVLNPKKIDIAIVGFGLTIFGIFYIIKSGLIDCNLPELLIKYAGWIIPSIFLLRTIGEFKYVGVFKRIKKTEFGMKDTKLYTPLCLLIGVLGIIIQLMK